jgi:NADH-quinone oxidoreductase subunit A
LNTGAHSAYCLWPMAVFFACAVIVVGLMIGVSFLLGQKHSGRVTNEPYESGMPAAEVTGLHFRVEYYLVAMFFLIFDAEALFIYAWAVSARALGWPGYIEIVVFIGILLAALLYISKLGAFAWGKPGVRKSREDEEEAW